MSRRFTVAPVIVSVLALAVAFAVSGCSQGHPSSSPKPTSKSSVAPTDTTPTPTPTPTFVPAKYTCDSLLPPATLAVFKSKASDGFALQPDFTQRVHNYDPNLSLFDDYGGILCQWAYPEGGNPVDYGFSPITAAQSTTEQTTLTTNGYVASKGDNGTLLANPDTTDFPDTYLFIDGYWFYASEKSLLDLIVENVFQTPGK
jgi:hypothetical protein